MSATCETNLAQISNRLLEVQCPLVQPAMDGLYKNRFMSFTRKLKDIGTQFILIITLFFKRGESILNSVT